MIRFLNGIRPFDYQNENFKGIKYSHDPNTALSGFPMVIFRTLFESNFLTVQKPDRYLNILLAKTILLIVMNFLCQNSLGYF
jgi:hypothetical protein